ncbi:histidine phosphatase family protein [Shewanella goraebulensis]|uniref:histidine phosphatase family protein n=1 Tax=Shewanella goraebulensis TaxID=3050637 RepID=UPI00254A53A6|nr:histidine phosphatase family protein [Shewanella goraebulensis]
MKQAKLILLRHGQCEGGDILRGKTDVTLSPLGWANMETALKNLDLVRQAPSLSIYSSPLLRCRQFAEETVADINQSGLFALNLSEQVAKSTTVPPLEIKLMPEFQEIDFGDWDGQTFDALYQNDPKALDLYWDNPWGNTPPKGEPMTEFEARVTSGLTEVTQQLESKLLLNQKQQESIKLSQENIATALIVTHGGVIRHIIGHILGLERCKGLYAQLAIDYAASVVIDVYWPEAQSLSHNSIDGNSVNADKKVASDKIKPVYRLNWPS